jgi:hypothetical protein
MPILDEALAEAHRMLGTHFVGKLALRPAHDVSIEMKK